MMNNYEQLVDGWLIDVNSIQWFMEIDDLLIIEVYINHGFCPWFLHPLVTVAMAQELSEFNHCSNLRGEKFRVLVADSLHLGGWQMAEDGEWMALNSCKHGDLLVNQVKSIVNQLNQC